MILVINNSGLLKNAYSTPKIINFLKKNKIKYKIISNRKTLNDVNKDLVKGIILSGSDMKYTEKMCTCKININLISLLEFTIPILGICFGFQTIGISYGGKISSLKKTKKTNQTIYYLENNELFNSIPNKTKFQQYHHDYLSDPPPSFKILAKSHNNIIQAIKHKLKPIYGVQFHPELSGKYGEQLLFNFINICYLPFNQDSNIKSSLIIGTNSNI